MTINSTNSYPTLVPFNSLAAGVPYRINEKRFLKVVGANIPNSQSFNLDDVSQTGPGAHDGAQVEAAIASEITIQF